MTRPPNASRHTRKLLSTLAENPRAWRHGYELSKETGLTSGTPYPSLMRPTTFESLPASLMRSSGKLACRPAAMQHQ